MGKVFLTGDKHGDFSSVNDYLKIKRFCEQFETTTDDIMIVLGDHGVHYDGSWRDYHAKQKLAKYPITFVMLRGNHDQRPHASWTQTFLDKDNVYGWFTRDPDFSNIVYPQEYGWYQFAGRRVFVIGGAYSADKWYRLEMMNSGYANARWFANEQLSQEEMQKATRLLLEGAHSDPFSIMSHTCPLNFKQIDNLLPGVDQSTVDETMEKWMDNLYLKLLNNGYNLEQWYCGHWHVDRSIAPMRFMYHDIIELARKEELQ